MAEAYLMHARNNFARFIDAISVLGEGNNYQIYIPEKGIIIGYFFNQGLGLSNNKFCKTNLKEYKKKELNYKISNGKFLKKFDVNNGLIEIILNSSKDLERAKVTFNINLDTFSNICKSPNHKFSKK